MGGSVGGEPLRFRFAENGGQFARFTAVYAPVLPLWGTGWSWQSVWDFRIPNRARVGGCQPSGCELPKAVSGLCRALTRLKASAVRQSAELAVDEMACGDDPTGRQRKRFHL